MDCFGTASLPGCRFVFRTPPPPPLACSRLRDGGEKSFSEKKCEKRAGAGERQGPLSQVALVALRVLIRPHYTI